MEEFVSKATMKEAIRSNRVDFIVQNVKKIKPSDRITFHIWGEYLKGVLKTKLGKSWKIEGDDRKDYIYMPV